MTRADPQGFVGAGPDLVLLHGWGLHAGVWSEVIPMLARTMRVKALDLPGHGHAPQVEDPCFDAAVDEVARQVPEGAVVCGWSLGGLVAQRLARRHPGRARRLVLACSTPRFLASEDWDRGMMPGTLEAFACDLAADAEATLSRFVKLNALHGARGRTAIREFTRQLATRPTPGPEMLRRALAWLRETDLRIDAPWVATPTLVVHGARDMLVPVGAGRWLAQALPHASLVEWPDAAHLPFFTHREAFVAAVESFVG